MSDGGAGVIAGDAGPSTWGDVSGVPGGERAIRVVKRELELVKVETLLVERENGRKKEEEERQRKKKCGHSCSASGEQSEGIRVKRV